MAGGTAGCGTELGGETPAPLLAPPLLSLAPCVQSAETLPLTWPWPPSPPAAYGLAGHPRVAVSSITGSPTPWLRAQDPRNW